jgi:hypothetical protein
MEQKHICRPHANRTRKLPGNVVSSDDADVCEEEDEEDYDDSESEESPAQEYQKQREMIQSTRFNTQAQFRIMQESINHVPSTHPELPSWLAAIVKLKK